MKYDLTVLRNTPAGRFLDDEKLKTGSLISKLRQVGEMNDLQFHWLDDIPGYYFMVSESTDIGVRIEEGANGWDIVGGSNQAHAKFSFTAAIDEIAKAVSYAIKIEAELYGSPPRFQAPIRIIMFSENNVPALTAYEFQTESEVDAFYRGIDLADAPGNVTTICSNGRYGRCSLCASNFDNTSENLLRVMKRKNAG